jgi:hypothetical protein
VAQLGQMRGAAMKLGQVLSTIDFTAIPEDDREEFKQTLAALRDDVKPVPFPRLRKLVESELGGKLEDFFAEFDQEAFAAASIGQVHKATTLDGRRVAVKIQYPGVAEAVETDLRNMQVLLPLIKRLAPGLDVKALAAELRERIAEELDYELEAQNQRAVERAWRGHPFVVVPKVDTSLSSRRVLVTELLDGRRFGEVKELPRPSATATRRSCSASSSPRCSSCGAVRATPTPATTSASRTARWASWTSASCGSSSPPTSRPSGISRSRSRTVKPRRCTGCSQSSAISRARRSSHPRSCSASWPNAGEWYFLPGFKRLSPQYVAETVELSSSPRSPYFDLMRRETLPPEALLLRRMEGLVFTVLGELRAGADWHALAREFFADGPPSTRSVSSTPRSGRRARSPRFIRLRTHATGPAHPSHRSSPRRARHREREDYSVDVPKTLSRQIAKVKAASDVPSCCRAASARSAAASTAAEPTPRTDTSSAWT